jgi:hypothetical protein
VLRFAFTPEGGVVLGSDIRNDEIMLRSTSPIILDQVAELISKVLGEPSGRRDTLIYLKNAIRYINSRGFLPGARAVRGRHAGIEKNVLLQILLSRHGLGSSLPRSLSLSI